MSEATRWWIAGAVGVLMVICVTFGLLVGPPSAPDEQVGKQHVNLAIEAAPSDARVIDGLEGIRAELEDAGLTDVPENLVTSLSTLEKIDDFPVYMMRYVGPYVRASKLQTEEMPADDGDRGAIGPSRTADWACALFAAVADPGSALFGRGFDWEYSPILVLLLEPEQGYRSIMSIDIAYLVEVKWIDRLDIAPVEQRLQLLSAPFLTFDGMNDQGLAIGMAAVEVAAGYSSDPGKRDVGDLRLMREVLESSATVEEAITFLEGINPVSQGGPNTHYLIADRTSSALIEYDEGEMVVFRSSDETPWQLGTNFPVVLTDGEPQGHCWRYDRIERSLREGGGTLSTDEAFDLLTAVSVEHTQWSIVYDLDDLVMNLCVGRDMETVHSISLARPGHRDDERSTP